ncbi:MAG: GxxExxY protein [Paludibacter sp.]|nr:GxxExxY protein [Paludibacter sp.]
MADLIFKDESYKIIGCCFEVYNQLGPGFLEAVYQEALAMEFTEQGVPFVEFAEMTINYKGNQLRKKYYPDFLCYQNIIVEIKALENLCSDHQAQVLNYLKGTNSPLGLLVNFGAARL